MNDVQQMPSCTTWFAFGMLCQCRCEACMHARTQPWSSVIPYLLPPSITIHGIPPLFNLRAWQSFSKISLQVFFGLPLGLAPSSSYSIHFFTQSLSSFHSTCLYHRNPFCGSTEIMSSNPSLSLNPLLGTLSCSLTPHIHLTILMSACWSSTSFSFLTGQFSIPCNILLHTQLLYILPLTHTTVLLLVWNMSASTRVSRYQKGKTKKVKTKSGFTGARDPPSHYQWYILVGNQWYQLPVFIPSNSNYGLHSCVSISVYTQHVT